MPRPGFVTGKLNQIEFALAEKFGRTVHELRHTMPSSEYAQWVAYYRYKENRRKQDTAKADAVKSVKRGKGRR